MNYWLVKTEPHTYSWDDLVQKGRDMWEGVRNYQARNNLKAMEVGDRVLVYHSGKDPSVVGIAEVVRAHYPDPTADADSGWVVVDITPISPLKHPVTLASIKAKPELQHIALVRASRLSVMPLLPADYEFIVALSEK